MDAVPAAERLVSHAFLNGVYAAPGCRIRSSQANILSAVAGAGKAFIGDALVLRHAIWAGMAEAAVIHIPAMEKRARGQGGVPGERRQATGGTILIDQLKELLGELLGFRGDRRRPIGSRQSSVLCRNQGRLIAINYAV